MMARQGPQAVPRGNGRDLGDPRDHRPHQYQQYQQYQPCQRHLSRKHMAIIIADFFVLDIISSGFGISILQALAAAATRNKGTRRGSSQG